MSTTVKSLLMWLGIFLLGGLLGLVVERVRGPVKTDGVMVHPRYHE